MVRLVLMIAIVASRAYAGACPISGDAELAATLRGMLAERACVAAHVERRGEAIWVEHAGAERVVGDTQTAATIIESWGSSAIAEPLLAARAVAPAERPTRGWQLFAAGERSFGSDGTRWDGIAIGGCTMFGPVCAGARGRFARVVEGFMPGGDRGGTELLVGGDVPIALGRTTLSPGFGGGIGMIQTHADGTHGAVKTVTGGLRADAHVTLSYPLGHGLALDAACSLDITQATHVETIGGANFPDEPWALARISLGVRYEAR